jgi:DTW domain-containing protein YfiP
VVVLQHPRERDKAVGTARIARLCLPNSEILVGVDFASSPRMATLLADAERPAVLLYPGPEARDLARDPPEGPVTLITIDGTWHQARSLLKNNPALLRLPHYAFAPERPSEYKIRREPRPDYVSTIEALSVALGALEGDRERFLALLAPLRAMVSMQVDFASRSPRGRHRETRRNEQTARACLPDALLSPELMCVTGEANAWPHDRAQKRPPHPHELVHWLAQRVGDEVSEAPFEAILAPRLPLAKSPLIHARLREEQLMQGRSVAAFAHAWQTFSGAADTLACWGPYALNLLRREGIALPPRLIDMRKVAGDFLKCRPGSLEELVESRALAFEPLGAGRGGERLGMLVSLTRWLMREARALDARAPAREQDSEAKANLPVHQ